MPIISHHAGLYDWGEYVEALKAEIPEDVSIPEVDINSFLNDVRTIAKFQLDVEDVNHWIRMLFSCLVDADWLDTERFMNESQYSTRKKTYSMQSLKASIDKKLAEFKANGKPSPINAIRTEIQEKCLGAAEKEPGFYSLTVPTGGGKTISSMVWAVNHALKYGKKRIIIAIPYTSIIVQTAQVLRNIFGEENVLEHHSNIDDSKIKDWRLAHKMRLASENWDYPIIVTTNVQLFESMFSCRPSDCRKLHNISNSVVILDEIQTLPVEFMNPIVGALKTYNKLFGTSVLFTTASMPVLDEDFKLSNGEKLSHLPKISEIIPAEMQLAKRMQRTTIHFEDENARTAEEIAKELAKHDRALCIVNTRKEAQEIFRYLPDEGMTIHLSRMMCPIHVRQTIDTIKAALKDDGQKIIRVVSTQLIEAGVDIDFPVVYRQAIGLDSVLQAAGRCNREGKMKNGDVFVFSTGHIPRGGMTQANNARLNLPPDSDWMGRQAMHDYFLNLYSRSNSFDSKDIRGLLNKQQMQFREASEVFRLIDDKGIDIVVRYGDNAKLIEKFKTEGPSYRLMKALSQYMVKVHDADFKKLNSAGLLTPIAENLYFAYEQNQYSEKIGLTFDNEWLNEILII